MINFLLRSTTENDAFQIQIQILTYLVFLGSSAFKASGQCCSSATAAA